eukprot:1773818-Rhodomonas_salina.1
MRLFCALVFSPLCVCLLLKWKDGSAAQRPESIPLLAESLFDAPVPWLHWVDAGELAIRFQWAEPEFDASVTSRLLRSSVVNHSPSKVSLDRAILLSIQHALPVDTAIYGEGFTSSVRLALRQMQCILRTEAATPRLHISLILYHAAVTAQVTDAQPDGRDLRDPTGCRHVH